MAEIKTKPTEVSVDQFIDAVPDPQRRADAGKVRAMMERITGEPAKMWGPSIIGFGSYHYKYDSGHEGTMCRLGFSPRKNELVLYADRIGAAGGAARQARQAQNGQVLPLRQEAERCGSERAGGTHRRCAPPYEREISRARLTRIHPRFMFRSRTVVVVRRDVLASCYKCDMLQK